MNLHVERRGSGPLMLLVHGLGGTLHSWDSIVGDLAARRELVLVDLPGHGQSPPLAGRQTIAAYADALEALVLQNGLDRAALVGSSVGGRLVLELARRGLGGDCVALDPGGFWRGWETQYFHVTLAASVRLVRALRAQLPQLSRHAPMRAMLMAQLSAKPSRLPADLVARELQTVAATPVFDAMLHELATGPVQQGALTPPGRVTIGWGRNDRLLLPRQAQRAHAAFPRSRLHWFEQCGHFPQWDQPTETVRVILQATG